MHNIYGSPIFQALHTLQRKLDALDIEGLLQLWSSSQEAESFSSSSSSRKPFEGVLAFEPSLEDWNCFVQRYLTLGPTPADALQSQGDLKFFLLSYLLSATFKDCSVIMKFLPCSSEAQLYVIDLDPKSISRLGKWLEQDQEIVSAFQDWVKDEEDMPPCVDDNYVLS